MVDLIIRKLTAKILNLFIALEKKLLVFDKIFLEEEKIYTNLSFLLFC